jgi:hypothetical protein
MIKAWTLAAQFGGPPGGVYVGGSGPVNGNLPVLPYVQNLSIPTSCSIVHMAGTITLKQPGSAVLITVRNKMPPDPVWAAGATIWQAEFQTPVFPPDPVWSINGRACQTWMVDVPFPASWGMNGQLWVDWQVYNGSGFDQGDGGLWEYQLTLHGQ